MRKALLLGKLSQNILIHSARDMLEHIQDWRDNAADGADTTCAQVMEQPRGFFSFLSSERPTSARMIHRLWAQAAVPDSTERQLLKGKDPIAVELNYLRDYIARNQHRKTTAAKVVALQDLLTRILLHAKKAALSGEELTAIIQEWQACPALVGKQQTNMELIRAHRGFFTFFQTDSHQRIEGLLAAAKKRPVAAEQALSVQVIETQFADAFIDETLRSRSSSSSRSTSPILRAGAAGAAADSSSSDEQDFARVSGRHAGSSREMPEIEPPEELSSRKHLENAIKRLEKNSSTQAEAKRLNTLCSHLTDNPQRNLHLVQQYRMHASKSNGNVTNAHLTEHSATPERPLVAKLISQIWAEAAEIKAEEIMHLANEDPVAQALRDLRQFIKTHQNKASDAALVVALEDLLTRILLHLDDVRLSGRELLRVTREWEGSAPLVQNSGIQTNKQLLEGITAPPTSRIQSSVFQKTPGNPAALQIFSRLESAASGRQDVIPKRRYSSHSTTRHVTFA